MKNYNSLSEAISRLKKKGYEDDFSEESFGLYSGEQDMRLAPEEFHVDEIDSVDVDSHPEDNSVVYAISSISGAKGVWVDPPGTDLKTY
jgi:hypothetical protein